MGCMCFPNAENQRWCVLVWCEFRSDESNSFPSMAIVANGDSRASNLQLLASLRLRLGLETWGGDQLVKGE